jgi:type III pantothenate kinase
MILTVNAGNTNVAYGIFDGLKLLRMGRVPRADYHLLPQKIGAERFTRILLGSVVPSMNDQIASSLAMACSLPVEVAGVDIPWRIAILCDEPAKVGADRVLNAIAAFARVKGACIVVDAGTAVTVNAVSRDGSLMGGAIAPGPAIMVHSLASRTELLPTVAPQKPGAVVGCNTADSIRAGLYYGSIGLVGELVARMRAEVGRNVPLLITGGAGQFLSDELPEKPPYFPALTLEGLAIMAAR